MKFVAAKCPNCGANIDVDKEMKEMFCAYCGSKIIVDEAIQKYQIDVNVSGQVSVDGIATKQAKEKRAEMAYSMRDYLKAEQYYEELMELDPENIEYGKKLLDCYNWQIDNAYIVYKSDTSGGDLLTALVGSKDEKARVEQQERARKNQLKEKIRAIQEKRKFVISFLQSKGVVGICIETRAEKEMKKEEQTKEAERLIFFIIVMAIVAVSVIIAIVT